MRRPYQMKVQLNLTEAGLRALEDAQEPMEDRRYSITHAGAQALAQAEEAERKRLWAGRSAS